MKTIKTYEKPTIEVVEIALEDAVLSISGGITSTEFIENGDSQSAIWD